MELLIKRLYLYQENIFNNVSLLIFALTSFHSSKQLRNNRRKCFKRHE